MSPNKINEEVKYCNYCENKECKVEYGKCHCGCHQNTNLVSRNKPKDFKFVGNPHKFVHTHHRYTGLSTRGGYVPREELKYGILDGYEVCYISLTKGQVTIVDVEDVEDLLKHTWLYQNGYAATTINGKFVHMHRYLMQKIQSIPNDLYIDHINGNKLDNRKKKNLRIASNAENQLNVGLTKKNTTGYKGVSKQINCSTYRACFIKQASLGQTKKGGFKTPEEAALYYDDMMALYRGEKALLNFPRPGFKSIYSELPDSFKNK